MGGKTILVATTMVALLAGCNRAATNNSANKAAPAANSANAAAPAANAATPAPAPAASAGSVDAAFLTANDWGMLDACASTSTFSADGTYKDSSATESGSWKLEGSTLTITEPNKSPETSTVRRDGKNLVVTLEGTDVTMTPCPAS